MPRTPSSWRGLARSFGYAWAGVWFAVRTQRNMRIHLFLTGLALAMALWVRLNTVSLLVLGLAVTLVLAAELFNTALEAAVDLYGTAVRPLARVAKDVAAGAVLLAAANALVTGLFLFGPRLGLLGSLALDLGRGVPAAAVAVAAALVLRPVRRRRAPAWGVAGAVALGTWLFAATAWAGPALALTLAGLVPACLGPGGFRTGGWSLLGGVAVGVLMGLLGVRFRF